MKQKTVTLRGHGWGFIPRAPFEIGRLPSAPDDVVIVHHGQPHQPKLRLSAASGGSGTSGMRLQLGPGTQAVEDVLEDWWDGEPPAPGDLHGAWIVDGGGLTHPWPAGTSLWSTQDHVDWPLELTAQGLGMDEMLYVQGPFTLPNSPKLERLMAAGMGIVGREKLRGASGGVDVLELSYSHEGQPWRQWRYLVPLGQQGTALVTAQAMEVNRALFLTLGRQVATQLRPLPGGAR